MKEITLANEVKHILSSSEQRQLRYASDLNWLNTWENLWTSDRIRVGVVGVTSSGKSTLINALLGDNLLSVAVRPSSSQLVSCSYAKERSAIVYFLDGKKKKIGDTAQLKESIVEYSDESYNKRNEKQVAQLELSTPNFDLGEDVLLVDSPGLDATGYEAHEKLTLETLLPTVDVVIFVTTVKSEVDKKMKQTLDTIAKYNCPVMVVQNMLDAVRPSVDGRKSAADVAKERMNRVRLAVEQSKIKNKNDVKISQISAVMAMQYRCQKEHTEEDTRKFKRSRYESFVSGVKELVESKRPEIERQRVKTILEHIEELIRQEDKRTQNISTNVLVDNTLTLVSESVVVALDATYDDIQGVIQELQQMYDTYFSDNSSTKNNKSTDFFSGIASSLFSSFSKESLDEDEIKEIKRVVKLFETKVVQSVQSFSKQCADAIKKLNLPTRDLWSYNGLPRMPEVEVKTKTVERSRTVNKRGVGNWLLRGLSNRKWGTETEHYTETVIDEEATRDSAKRYIERLQFEYGKTLEAWHTNAKSTVSSIQQEIDLRLAAIKEKEQQVMDAADWKEIRAALEKCRVEYGGIKSAVEQPESKPEEQRQETQDNAKLIRVPAKIARLHDAAEKYLFAVQSSSFNYAIESQGCGGCTAFVVSNSPDNLSDFLYRFYGVKKNDFSKETIHRLSDELTVACSPTEAQLKALERTAKGINVFLLINGLQFHTEYETTLRHAVQSILKETDTLFLVVQDFEILANGNAITECIRTVRMEQGSHKGMVLISHKNPVYNMAIIHAQTTEGKLKEETMFYNSLTTKFPSLVDEIAKKRINNILRT